MRWRLVAGLAILAVIPMAVPRGPSALVEAGTAIRMGTEDLVLAADLVLKGRVVSLRAAASPTGRIDTVYTLAVRRTFWGSHEPTRIVRIPGGVLADGRGMIVPGLAGLALGEDVVLMLSPASADGARMPIGLAQGEFRIVTDRFGKRVAVRSTADLALASGVTGVVLPGAGASIVDYAELVATIESAAATKRAIGEGR
jgi:hypothetical protein